MEVKEVSNTKLDSMYDTDKIVDYFIGVHKDIDNHFEELITMVSGFVPENQLSKYRSKMHDLKELMSNFGKTFWINKKEAEIYRDKVREYYDFEVRVQPTENGFLVPRVH